MTAYFRRNKNMSEGNKELTYQDIEELKKYITPETGKIVPSRITCTPTSLQRQISNAIKIARFLALLPFCDGHK